MFKNLKQKFNLKLLKTLNILFVFRKINHYCLKIINFLKIKNKYT